jgi:signal transduction histidine kinase
VKYFLAFAFILKVIISFGNSITIGEKPEVFSFFKPNTYVSHYSNVTNLNPNELFKALDEHKFKLLKQNIYNAGSTNSYHYLSVEIINTKTNNELIYWLIKNSAINRIQLYSRTHNKIIVHEEFGDYYKFDKRPDDFFLLGVPLNIVANTSTTFILKIDKRNENLFLPFNFYYPKYYQQFKNHLYLIYGLFIGVLILMALINLFLYFSFKDSIHLYYIVYVFANLFVILSFEGIDFQLFYPNYPQFSNISRYFSTCIELAMATVLYRKFVGIPIWDRRNIIQILLTICLVCNLFFIPFSFFVFNEYENVVISKTLFLRVFSVTNFLTMGLIIISAIQKYRSGFKPALFFIVAVGLLYIGGIEYSLNTNGIITDNLLFKNIIPNTLVYGIMGEVIIVCLGIVSRYNRFKKESDDFQKQIIKKQLELNNASIVFREQERKRISDNIHDEIASRIFGVRMMTEAIKNKTKSPELFEQLNELRLSLDTIADKTRSVILELNDSSKTTLASFIKELVEMINEFAQTSQKKFIIDKLITNENFEFPQLTSDQLIITCREIFTNFLRHSSSKELSIAFKSDNNSIEFNLIEFESKENPLPFKEGNGILSIKKRIESIDGNVYWKFDGNLNTIISVSIEKQTIA